MAKSDSTAARKVGQVMHEFKDGKLKSGSTGKAVKNPKHAMAPGLAEARRRSPDSSAAPPTPDTGTSVAGEEDPGAALDQTGIGAARLR